MAVAGRCQTTHANALPTPPPHIHIQCASHRYGALFPFSWKRGDLCCDYWYHKGREPTSLFEGQGWDWSSAYSFHLFHSQSESFFKNDDAYSIKQMLKGTDKERKNWPNALALALNNDFDETFICRGIISIFDLFCVGHDDLSQRNLFTGRLRR